MSANASPLLKVYRNEVMESVHHGHIVVVNNDGQILAHTGQNDVVTYIRSTAKPLQAIPLIEKGGDEQFGLTAKEIAVICASHNGEDAHRQAVQSILNKIGASSNELRCGIHSPWLMRTDNAHAVPQLRPDVTDSEQAAPHLRPDVTDSEQAAPHLRPDVTDSEQAAPHLRPGVTDSEQAAPHLRPSVLGNNCSGKHAGMLALARLLDVDSTDYDQPEHPVQQHMLHAVAAMANISAQAIQLGVDGCGVPVFAMPLHALATAYARLGHPETLPEQRQEACKAIVDALKQAPFYLAGTKRFDTELIRITKGRIIGKMGAEGLYALSIPEAGLGVAVKISDGARRATSPVVIETLRQLDALTAMELEQLAQFHQPLQHNHRGDPVGKLTPILQLKQIDKFV